MPFLGPIFFFGRKTYHFVLKTFAVRAKEKIIGFYKPR